MSLTQEQMIERLRRNNEAFNRGEFDAVIRMADPEIDSLVVWTFNDTGVTRVEAFQVHEEEAARRALPG
ncbi:MAG: hypothetical protein WBV53_11695 [Solirubrobacterales bacterium]